MKIIHRLFFICMLGAFIHVITPTHRALAGDAVVSTCNFASLQSAVTTANSGGGTITFTCSGTITFSSELTITNAVTINGGGNVVLDGNNTTRLFTVNTGATLTLNHVTVQNGRVSVIAGDGGAIRATGNLSISHSTFNNNVTQRNGGAIHATGNLSISHSTFSNNATLGGGGNGGAIYATGTLSISHSTFSNNNATFGGGGVIWALNSETTITNSTFTNNLALSDGGAIHSSSFSLTISDSTFTDNTTQVGGGALLLANFIYTITNSTFTDNTAEVRGGAIDSIATEGSIIQSVFSNNEAFTGGAVASTNALTITNSTFANNTLVGTQGTAVWATGNTTITHSTFLNNAPNTFHSANNTLTATHSIISGSGSLCTTSGGGALNINTTNLSNIACGSATVFTNLGLGTFDGRVVPLLSSSVAVNRSATPCAIATDQLGNNRPFGIGCDVGAVEFINPIFNEQELLIVMQAESVGNTSPVYPLVLDVIPNGLEIALRDGAGQIGTATLDLVHQNGVLSIRIAQTTGIFADVIYAHLPQLVMWALDELFAQAGVVEIRIRQMTLNPASIAFEMGSP